MPRLGRALLGLGLSCGALFGCATTSGGPDEPQGGASSDADTAGDGDGDRAESSGRADGDGDGDAVPGDGDGDGDGDAAGDGDGEGDSVPGDGDGDGATTVEVVGLSYGEAFSQSLDLYTASPKPVNPSTFVVLAHGGLWQSGDKSSLANLCTWIVESSAGAIACASINYRLSDSLGGGCVGPGLDTYREQVHDLAAAVALLQSVSAEHGLDPGSAWVGGHSAGAHLAQLFNLRYAAFAAPCPGPGLCAAPRGAIGFEGIYDVGTWDSYDADFWMGQFSCATRKAFGAPADANSPCLDPELSPLACWDAGSPRYLAEHHQALAATPSGPVLLIHSPGDDWVPGTQAVDFEQALEAAFPQLDLIRSSDGGCATGQHVDVLNQMPLAACISSFVASEGTQI